MLSSEFDRDVDGFIHLPSPMSKEEGKKEKKKDVDDFEHDAKYYEYPYTKIILFIMMTFYKERYSSSADPIGSGFIPVIPYGEFPARLTPNLIPTLYNAAATTCIIVEVYPSRFSLILSLVIPLFLLFMWAHSTTTTHASPLLNRCESIITLIVTVPLLILLIGGAYHISVPLRTMDQRVFSPISVQRDHC